MAFGDDKLRLADLLDDVLGLATRVDIVEPDASQIAGPQSGGSPIPSVVRSFFIDLFEGLGTPEGQRPSPQDR